jgi:predicted phosphodiesterase
MKIAIFSDVHSNLPALEAVLTDIKRQRASIQVYLGDIVGYNAEPARCVERVRETCDDVIQGNHDEACAVDFDIADFSSIAQVPRRRKSSPPVCPNCSLGGWSSDCEPE